MTASAPGRPSWRARPRFRLRAAAASAGAGTLGVAPHVLHHGGPLAGAALVSGAGGTILFGALGLALTVPLLVRVGRRTGSWHAPAALLALFAAMFTLSSLVLGPAIASDDPPVSDRRGGEQPADRPAGAPRQHDGHHAKP